MRDVLLLGVDGGGTRCRARLADLDGSILGEGMAGPANVRLGLQESFAAVHDAACQCFHQAGFDDEDRRTVACLALAGASEPLELARARAHPHPFYRAVFTTDAQAACVGAHEGRDGGIIIVGTGSIGWATIAGKDHRIGGWGFPVSDESSGAWLGCEVLRRALWARDGLIPWTHLLRAVFDRFGGDPHAIVRWMGTARPRDFGSLAPLVFAHAEGGDAIGRELVERAAAHIDVMTARLAALGAERVALMGGLADKLQPFLSGTTRGCLVAPRGDALSGALRIARAEAECLALT